MHEGIEVIEKLYCGLCRHYPADPRDTSRQGVYGCINPESIEKLRIIDCFDRS